MNNHRLPNEMNVSRHRGALRSWVPPAAPLAGLPGSSDLSHSASESILINSDGHFNPTALTLDGRTILLARHETNTNQWGASRASHSLIDLSVSGKPMNRRRITTHLGDHFQQDKGWDDVSLTSPRIEDVRFVPASDRRVDGRAMVLVTASAIHRLNPWLVAIGLFELDIDRAKMRHVAWLSLSHPSATEKNWLTPPADHDVHFTAYRRFFPLEVCHFDEQWNVVEGRIYPYRLPPWIDRSISTFPHIVLAGSAGPVAWDDDHWLIFVHTRVRKEAPLYEHFAMLVERTTHRPVALSRRPVLRGDWEPLRSIVFLTGVIRRNEGYLLYYGWKDREICSAEVPRRLIAESLVQLIAT